MVDSQSRDRSPRRNRILAVSTALVGCLSVVMGASSAVAAPQQGQQRLGQQRQAQQQQAPPRQAVPGQQAALQQPFPALNQEEQTKVDQVLLAWQQQSQATKTLACKFERWHYDLLAAPAGVHSEKAEGQIRYAKPDKGLFKVDELMFYKGMKDNKPQYGAEANRFGEYWICNGIELFDYDQSAKKCTIQALPPQMQGKEIFNSPLPFVFNSDAQEIKKRFWVRLQPSPKPNTLLIEAWPKSQADRSQYKLVQVVLNTQYEPDALIMYAPNFHQKLAPQWDLYEFKEVKRNGIAAGIANFMDSFIPKKPPATWQVVREKFLPPQIAGGQQQPGQPAVTPRR